MRKNKTIQNSLFLSFSVLIISVILIFVFFFYTYTSNVLTQRASDSFEKLANSVSGQIDQEIRKMDIVSLNIAYSDLVRRYFNAYLVEDSKFKYEYSKALINLFISITGPLQTVRQINLYSFDGQMIGAGFLNQGMKISLDEKPWFEKVLNLNGKKYISVPYNNSFFLSDTNLKQNKYFISLYRVCFNRFGEKEGIIETAQDCQSIFRGIENVVRNKSENIHVFVFNEDGRLIFPNNVKEDNYSFYYRGIKPMQQKNPLDSFIIQNPSTKEEEVIAYNYSDYTGWSVLIVQPAKKVLSPVIRFTAFTVLITIVMLAFSLIFSFFMAGKLTNPIRRIHEAIQRTELDNLTLNSSYELNSNVNELEELNLAFQAMSIKLKQSLDDLLMAKQQEMQARMLALQSQMNSHFIYNSLSIISIMAEENMNESIVKMCKNISFILRYISSGQSSVVPIKMEIEYTEKYLECMQLRYGSNLSFSIQIDDNIKELKIPKLLIQPLVENAIKYGTNIDPPWYIQIYGYLTENRWQITIHDNGPGFNNESLEDLRDKIKRLQYNNSMPDAEIEGMGLINIFTRLKLAYKDQMIFKVENDLDGGALVTIGGSIIH